MSEVVVLLKSGEILVFVIGDSCHEYVKFANVDITT
jgi:hypothetical protein